MSRTNSMTNGSKRPHQLWLLSETWKYLKKVKVDFISDENPEPTWDLVIQHLCKLYENSVNERI